MPLVATFARWVVRLRWPVVVVTLLIVAFFGAQLPRSELDTEMKNQLPADLPARLNLREIERLFGGTDLAMIVLSAADVSAPATVARLQRLTRGMQGINELEKVVTPFTAKYLRLEADELLVEQAIEQLPTTAGESKRLRARLRDNPLVHGRLVSEDFRHAALIGFAAPSASDEALVSKLERLLEEEPGPEEARVGGLPLTRVSLTRDMRRDMRRFLPIGLLLMLIFLAACFRRLAGMLLPFVVTVMSIVVTMGLLPLLHWKIHTVTTLLPVILLAVANDYGIHVMARYQEDNALGTELAPAELARRGIVALARPVLATGVTTMVGLCCLMTHLVVPAKQLGALAACGVGFAMFGSLAFIPAVLSLLPRARPLVLGQASKFRLERALLGCARGVCRRPRAILAGCLGVAALVGLGAARVEVDTNPMSFYERSEPIWQSTHVLNEHLGGWAGLSVVVGGDVESPSVLREIEELEQYLARHEFVGTTSSIAGMLGELNQLMHDGDPAHGGVPETRQLVAQYLLLYSMSGDADDLAKLVDFDHQHAQVFAKVTDSGTRAATELLAYTQEYLDRKRSEGASEAATPSFVVGGLLHVMAELVDHVVRGQLISMALAALLVTLLVAAWMRSIWAGLYAVFPLLLSLSTIFGLMGFLNIELNLVTALLSSIMIGVGVDYSIHFLWRYREALRSGAAPEAAVLATLTTTGRGIVFNALSVVVGFVVLVVSAFFPVRFFGLLVAVSILAALVGALVVLPALALVFRPRFLEGPGGRS